MVIKHYIAFYVLLALILISCSNRPAGKLHPEGSLSDVAAIGVVTVSKPDAAEVDRLPSFSKLNLCLTVNYTNSCKLLSGTTIVWGLGFCKPDQATLDQTVASAQVELVVENVRIPNSMIFQRDETYDRQLTGFCHTWLVKLSNWKAGQTVRLETNAYNGTTPIQNNRFSVEVVD